MKRHWLLTALGAILAGAGLHFLWQALPNPLFALISPVNESVWEHLKLLFWPYLGAAWCLVRGEAEPWRAWTGHLAVLLAMPVGLLGVYYALAAGFRCRGLWIDIPLYYLALGGGFALARHLGRWDRAARWAAPLLLGVCLYAVLLTLFTFAAPALPVFTP